MILKIFRTAGACLVCARALYSTMRVRHAVLLLAAVCVLSGCMNATGQPPGHMRASLSKDGADAPEEFDRRTALGRNSEPSMVTLGIGDALRERLASDNDDLPDDVYIKNTNLNGVPVAAALQAVLADTNISLTWQQGGDFDERVVTILNLSGRLPQVVERVCQAARIYCSYRNNTLELLEKETFIIEMPPIPGDTENTIATTIGLLASGASEGGDVQVDTQGGNIIYTTDMAGQMRVRQYLTQLRRGRPLIVMQIYIWEVTLNEDLETGIKWDSDTIGNFTRQGTTVSPFSGSGLSDITADAAKTSFASLANNISFGAVFSGTVDAAAIVAFLQQSGQVESVSNPQMTFVSGTESEFTIGGKRSYISGVGQLVGSTVSSGGSSNNTGVGSNTVQTEEIETGLSVKLKGAYESGVVFGELEIEDTTLVDIERIESAGTEIQLPITQERKLNTVVRLRPGDTMLLAGLRTQNDAADRSGMPTFFGMIPTRSRNEVENREMVIMLRPSIIRFADDTPVKTKARARAGDAARDPIPSSMDVVQEAPPPAPLPVSPSPLPPPAEPVTLAPLPPKNENEISTDSLQRTFDDVYRRATGQGGR